MCDGLRHLDVSFDQFSDSMSWKCRATTGCLQWRWLQLSVLMPDIFFGAGPLCLSCGDCHGWVQAALIPDNEHQWTQCLLLLFFSPSGWSFPSFCALLSLDAHIPLWLQDIAPLAASLTLGKAVALGILLQCVLPMDVHMSNIIAGSLSM